MIRPAARAAALLVFAPFLTFVSALAPAHVHETADGDHEDIVAHSHFAPHHVEAQGHDDGPDIDHPDDEHVVWIDGATLHEGPYQVDAPLAAIALDEEPVRVDRQWSVTPSDAAAPAHGPPKPVPPFRGPPCLV